MPIDNSDKEVVSIRSGDGQPVPSAVMRAMMHVRSHHYEVTLLVFKADTRWVFMSDEGDFPIFGNSIDVSLLEDAQNSVTRFPAVFEIVPSSSETHLDPVKCPFCGSKDVTYIDAVAALVPGDDEPDHPLDLQEYQCAPCGNRSFWV